MGTRSLTVFEEEKGNGREIAVMYRQCDGYLGGHGSELLTFLGGRYLTINGFNSSVDKEGIAANGMNCLAADVISHFKSKYRLGNIYLYPQGTRDAGEEFVYFIYPIPAKQTAPGGRVKIGVDVICLYGKNKTRKKLTRKMCGLGAK